MNIVNAVASNPKIIFPSNHLLLISHMRANTTLIGHLIGSHDEFSGYYEMHIGYYSWKSLVNQKIVFHQSHRSSPVTKFYFDKILHSEHYIEHDVMKKSNVNVMFTIREPQETIASIVKLYRKQHPNDDFTSVDYAARYYIERLCEIAEIAKKLVDDDIPYFYYDAATVVENTEILLNKIARYLNVDKSFPLKYKTFTKTGEKIYGDSSPYIFSGKVVKKKRMATEVDIDPLLLQRCLYVYNNCRNYLMANSYDSCCNLNELEMAQ